MFRRSMRIMIPEPRTGNNSLGVVDPPYLGNVTFTRSHRRRRLRDARRFRLPPAALRRSGRDSAVARATADSLHHRRSVACRHPRPIPVGYQDHAITETAPGHASTMSGRFPAHTGITSNSAGVIDPGFRLINGPPGEL